MHSPWLLPILLSLACTGAVPAAPSLHAAEPAADPDALRQKNEEIERLRRELERAERERDQLQRDNEQLRREQQRATSPAPTPRPARKPVTPIADRPPLTADTQVEVDELVGHFTAEPATAANRYTDQSFRILGQVERFSRSMVAREFVVLLASPDPSLTVRCRFNYVDRYRSVFLTRDGRQLTARHNNGREEVLLETGQNATLTGRCQGLKDGTITFTHCALVP
ncbi:MAG: hypothetical protein HS113_13965 [Verrucomicrobiales bacterium]|nr:hypothetical protein [Verrucomicrobiales bacterium]